MPQRLQDGRDHFPGAGQRRRGQDPHDHDPPTTPIFETVRDEKKEAIGCTKGWAKPGIRRRCCS